MLLPEPLRIPSASINKITGMLNFFTISDAAIPRTPTLQVSDFAIKIFSVEVIPQKSLLSIISLIVFC